MNVSPRQSTMKSPRKEGWQLPKLPYQTKKALETQHKQMRGPKLRQNMKRKGTPQQYLSGLDLSFSVLVGKRTAHKKWHIQVGEKHLNQGLQFAKNASYCSNLPPCTSGQLFPWWWPQIWVLFISFFLFSFCICNYEYLIFYSKNCPESDACNQHTIFLVKQQK